MCKESSHRAALMTLVWLAVLAAESYGKPQTLVSLTPSMLRRELNQSQRSLSISHDALAASPDSVHDCASNSGTQQGPHNTAQMLSGAARRSQSSALAAGTNDNSHSVKDGMHEHSPECQPHCHTPASDSPSRQCSFKFPPADALYSPGRSTRASCLSTRTSVASNPGKSALAPAVHSDAPLSGTEEPSGTDRKHEEPGGIDGSPDDWPEEVSDTSGAVSPPVQDTPVSRPAFRRAAFTSERKASFLEPPLGVEYSVRHRQSAFSAHSVESQGPESQQKDSNMHSSTVQSRLEGSSHPPASGTLGPGGGVSSISDPWSSVQRNKYTMHSRSNRDAERSPPIKTVDAVFVSQAKEAPSSPMNSLGSINSTGNGSGAYGARMSHSSAFNSTLHGSGAYGSKSDLKHSLSKTYHATPHSRTYTSGTYSPTI